MYQLWIIYYAALCKACSITEEHTAAKEQVFTPLSKEQLTKFLARVKIKMIL
jgi:hypothetical protein